MRKYERHGGRHSSMYRVWCAMKTRCLNPNSGAYANYGGRGITVCKEWVESFDAFRRDMGERPEGTTIDRIDNNRGYEPGNCRWATRSEQSRNRRITRILTIDGKAASIAEWSDISGIRLHTIWYRLELGWSERDAVMQPLITKRKGIPRGQRLYTAFGAERGVEWSEPESAAVPQ